MEAVSVCGQTMAFRRQGTGLPVLFLHGLGADSSQCLAPFGSMPGIDLICPDMPGHGLSHGSDFSFARFADLTIGLLDALGIESAVLGGISMGAAIALRAALQAPERVKGLVLVRPAWIDRAALPHLALVGRVGRWLATTPAGAGEKLAADPQYLAVARGNGAAAQSISGLLTRPQAIVSADVLSAMVHDRPFNRLSALDALTCSALVLANDDDPLHPTAVAQDIFAALPVAHYHLVPSRYGDPAIHFAALQSAIAAFLSQQDLIDVHRAHDYRDHPRQAQG